MKTLQERLAMLEKHVKDGNITVLIFGLGSVGTYLLDYLISRNDETIKVVVAGRSFEKMEKNVNIVRVASLIRGLNKTNVEIEPEVDLTDIDTIQDTIQKYSPDFIVNSSRAYSGLKYGSISWENVRAYGIWTPLAVRFTKNVMEACHKADTHAVVINTSYSDAVIPWLKSRGKAYPDFGSGNLNHLIPRIKFSAAKMLGVEDFWNVDVMFAAGHFHDVCISKEGQTEGIELPLKIYYNGQEKELDHREIFNNCKIAMPVDAQRNMMNASSNYRIIDAVISAIRNRENQKVFIPGAFGNLGGYPVQIGYKDGKLDAWIDESEFSFVEMDTANRASMALDGIEDIVDGTLIYTDTLIEKVKSAFDVELPKKVLFNDIDKTAEFIIDEIIIPQTAKRVN
ncbi:MAG: NAD-dependent epimerase/dehydratase family protein [Hungatella sp.]|nr:NAD-dependent epimerase/dehydratase family protein [Hungatella sp.]